MTHPSVNLEALKSDIRAALINHKAFAGPIAMRVAWHASGTYDKSDSTGGSDGATMRFEPEISDDANAGLHIVRHMLHTVKEKYPEVSLADLWTYAGTVAIEFMGGPKVPHRFGRTDKSDGASCPAHGRLPDASQGAAHLREVFARMGFNDQEIVALSGGHTVGRCHAVRSGFDGPWTRNPLQFDNAYFKHLLEIDWKEKDWSGNRQFTDPTDTLMMLPTDIALIEDAAFKTHVERYAADQELFFTEFSTAYAKLLALGCPEACDTTKELPTADNDVNAQFRELAMHGSINGMQKLVGQVNVKEVEASSGRSALHKAAFWGHVDATRLLLELALDVNLQDSVGDTALHDAIHYGHPAVAQQLIDAGTNLSLKNHDGLAPLAMAVKFKLDGIVNVLKERA